MLDTLCSHDSDYAYKTATRCLYPKASWRAWISENYIRCAFLLLLSNLVTLKHIRTVQYAITPYSIQTSNTRTTYLTSYFILHTYGIRFFHEHCCLYCLPYGILYKY